METQKLNIRTQTLFITKTALFGALAIVFGLLESLIPTSSIFPPGVKLGFSNIVVMFSAGTQGLLSAVCIAVIKGGFVFLMRGMTAGILSICAAVVSAVVMAVIFKFFKGLGLIGVSVAGAVSHNLTQLVIAIFITQTPLWVYLPILLISAVICGCITGVTLKIVLPVLLKKKR